MSERGVLSMKKRSLTTISMVTMLSAALAAGVAPGCGFLMEALSALGFEILGVTPADDFITSGLVELSLLPKDGSGGINLGSFDSADAAVVVVAPDGTEQECEYVEEEIIEPSRFNSVALLIDDSGSMENYYPQDEYGDLCLSCPHDPNRVRVLAAGDLTEVLIEEAPYSRISIMSFGPDVSEGMEATRVLADFTNDADALLGAIDGAGSTERAGTPLWQSLAEIISGVDADAEMTDEALAAKIGAGTVAGESPSTPYGEPIALPEDVTADEEAFRFIVVISDGDNYNLEDETTLDMVIDLAQAENVVIHAIGLGTASSSNDPLLNQEEQKAAVEHLQRLASETGGYYASVDDADELRELYSNIAMSVSGGYAQSTFSCLPSGDENAGTIGPGTGFESGEHVEGSVTLGGSGVAVPFSFIAP
jgi:hypothetical protein